MGNLPYLPRDLPPQAAVDFTLSYLDDHPDVEDIGRAALFIGEPLVDWHGTDVADRLVELMSERADLRLLIRGCDFDDSVPATVRARLYDAAEE
jgi:hypothetical protein